MGCLIFDAEWFLSKVLFLSYLHKFVKNAFWLEQARSIRYYKLQNDFDYVACIQ